MGDMHEHFKCCICQKQPKRLYLDIEVRPFIKEPEWRGIDVSDKTYEKYNFHITICPDCFRKNKTIVEMFEFIKANDRATIHPETLPPMVIHRGADR